MKKVLFYCLIFALSSCTKSTQDQDVSSETVDLKSKTWLVISIVYNGNELIRPSLAASEDYLFSFTNDSIFRLNMAVNDITGSYYSISNNIDFDNIGSTKVCCDSSFDESLKSILNSANKYYYSSGNLTLQDGENKILLKSI